MVELASEHAAWAGKLLADLGAEVTLVEPPGGHATRTIGPFLDDRPGPERSLWWWHHHTSKNGVVLDLDTPVGVELLHRLVARSDIVLEAEQPGHLVARGVDRDRIMTTSPSLIWVSVSPFGQEGPRAQDPATDLTLMAGGGPVWNCGYDDHSLPPVRGLGGQAAHVAGVHAAMATLTAVVHRDASGMGQHIDVNMHAALNVTTEVGSYEWLVAQHTVQRQTGRHASVSPTSPTQVQAADGSYVTLGFPPRHARDYQAILDWLDELGIGSAFPDLVLLEMAVERGGVSIVELGQDPIADQIWSAARGPWRSSPPMWTHGHASTDSSSGGSSAASSTPPKRSSATPTSSPAASRRPSTTPTSGGPSPTPACPWSSPVRRGGSRHGPHTSGSTKARCSAHSGLRVRPTERPPHPGSLPGRRIEPVVQAGVLPLVGAVDGAGRTTD